MKIIKKIPHEIKQAPEPKWEEIFPRHKHEVSRKASRLFEINKETFYRINFYDNLNVVVRSLFVVLKEDGKVEDRTL